MKKRKKFATSKMKIKAQNLPLVKSVLEVIEKMKSPRQTQRVIGIAKITFPRLNWVIVEAREMLDVTVNVNKAK